MKTFSVKSNPKKQGGFTLLELVIVVTIIAVLVSAASQVEDSDKAKAAVLLQNMDTISAASTRLRMDAGCFPLRPDALFVQASAATSSCGADLRARWRGPYTADNAVDGGGDFLIPNIAASSSITLRSAPGGRGTQYFVRAINVPNSLINTALETCNGGVAAAGKCVGTTGGGGTGAFEMKYAETL